MKFPKLTKAPHTGKKPPKKPKKTKTPDTVAGNGTIEQAHASTIGRYGIWAIVLGIGFTSVLGTTMGAAALLNNPTATVTQELKNQQDQDVFANQAAAYAQGYLTAYLTASKDNYQDLVTYIGQDAAQNATFKVTTGIDYRNPVIASVEKTNYGYYSTKIQIETKHTEHIEENGETREKTTWETHWYKVVTSTNVDGTHSPVGYPAATNAPSTNIQRTTYPYSVANPDVTSAVGDFGKAYLTETGDINRYISPTATITALSPAPYQSAALTSVTALTNMDGPVPADGTTAYVLAEFEVTDQATNTRRQTYPLELTSRGGRWEISTIERSPHTF